jgi:hypothetical protein
MAANKTNGAGDSSVLEHQAEMDRARLAETLDVLRSRMSPGQILDQVIEYSGQHGAGEFFRSLGQQVKSSPLPVALIGTGIAWLMMSPRGDATRNGSRLDRAAGKTTGEYADTARDAASSALQVGRETMHDTSAAIGATASAMGRGAARSYEALESSARNAGATMRETAATASDAFRNAAHSASETGARSKEAVLRLAQDQPLVLAAIGVALGGLLGSLLPRTQTEDELVGRSSDAVKERVERTAEEQLESVRESAKVVVEAAVEETKAQLNAADGMGDVGAEASLIPEGASPEARAARDEAHQDAKRN